MANFVEKLHQEELSGDERDPRNPDSNDLVISRFLRAPRAALWKAWADPNHLKEWWCPKPWTTEVRAFGQFDLP